MFVEIYSALSVATESAAIATGKLISHILGRSSRAPRRSYLLLGLGAPRSRAPLAVPLSCYFLVSLFYLLLLSIFYLLFLCLATLRSRYSSILLPGLRSPSILVPPSRRYLRRNVNFEMQKNIVIFSLPSQ